MRSEPPAYPPSPPTGALDEQLRAVGRRLDEAAPPVGPAELAGAPSGEVAHLVAADPDATRVIPLLPVPPMADDVPPRRRRGRVLGVAAAALAVLAAGGVAVAMSADDDEVRTDQAAQLQPVSEPDQGPAGDPAADPEVDLGGFGEVAESFAACMEGAGFTVEAPGGEGSGFGSFEELAGLVADPAFFDALRECTAGSGIADLDIAEELEGLDLEGTLEEQLGGTLDETLRGVLDDVLAEVEGVDMAEVSAQLDAWLAQVEAELLQEDLREHVVEEARRADQVIACMEQRGWSVDSFEGTAEQSDQLLDDLRECTEEG